MRRASIRDLHIRTSELVREAAEGDVIVIEKRGEPVAELRPIGSAPNISAAKKAQIFASMQKIWDRMPEVSGTTEFLEEDRDR